MTVVRVKYYGGSYYIYIYIYEMHTLFLQCSLERIQVYKSTEDYSRRKREGEKKRERKKEQVFIISNYQEYRCIRRF